MSDQTTTNLTILDIEDKNKNANKHINGDTDKDIGKNTETTISTTTTTTTTGIVDECKTTITSGDNATGSFEQNNIGCMLTIDVIVSLFLEVLVNQNFFFISG
jgi:hypothetical protein